MAKRDKLTALQQAFLREFLLCRKPAEAMRRAGYKSKNPDVDASELLKHPIIKAAVEAHEKELQTKFEISKEKIIEELSAIAFGHVGKVATWGDDYMGAIPKDQMSEQDMKFIDSVEKISIGEAVTKVSVKTLSHQKIKALELLGKHIGMWKEQKDAGSENDSDSRRAILSRLSQVFSKSK